MLHFPSPQPGVSKLALLHTGKWAQVWFGNSVGNPDGAEVPSGHLVHDTSIPGWWQLLRTAQKLPEHLCLGDSPSACHWPGFTGSRCFQFWDEENKALVLVCLYKWTLVDIWELTESMQEGKSLLCVQPKPSFLSTLGFPPQRNLFVLYWCGVPCWQEE